MNGKWSDQQVMMTETKERNRTRKEKLAGYFFDISKLTFAAIVLGGLSPVFGLQYEFKDIVMLIFGLITTVSFAIFANKILK